MIVAREAPPLSSPWADAPDAVVRALDSSVERGLSESEARRRLRRHGPNQLRQHDRRSVWDILRDQFKSLIVALLVVGS